MAWLMSTDSTIGTSIKFERACPNVGLCAMAALVGSFAIIGVSTAVGWTLLTRMRCGANPWLNDRPHPRFWSGVGGLLCGAPIPVSAAAGQALRGAGQHDCPATSLLDHDG